MEALSPRVRCFEPVIDKESRVLILGSMPSIKSLEAHFYYAHPRNAFWPILASLFGAPLPQSVQEKIALALRNRVALWDVLRACDRKGSGDAAIRRVEITTFRLCLRRIRRFTPCFSTARRPIDCLCAIA